MIDYVWLVPLFPLIGVFVNGLLGKKLGDKFVGVITEVTRDLTETGPNRLFSEEEQANGIKATQ